MEQLLQIRTVPISYEMKINHARLEQKSGTVDLQISRDKGGLRIQSNPVKIQLDSFNMRNSMIPTVPTAIKQAASKGQSAAYDVTARYASEGKLMLEGKIGEGSETINQILANRTAQPTGDFTLGFAPGAPIEMEATELDFTIEYQMDKLNFDWKVDSGQVEFIPGNIEFTVTQQPDVVIEYVGPPIYVPPSAMERLTGQIVDVKA